MDHLRELAENLHRGRGPGRRQERFKPTGPRPENPLVANAQASGEVVIRAIPADLMEEYGSVEFPPYSHMPLAVEVYQQIQRGEGANSDELLAAADQLRQHGHKKLAARLTSLAKDPPSELLGVDATPTINMRLTAEELDGLGWIANRYESGRLLYGAYDDEAGTFDVDEVIAAYRATAGDGGDLGTVPNAGGSLAKKIDLLFDKSGAYWMEDDE